MNEYIVKCKKHTYKYVLQKVKKINEIGANQEES